MGVEPGADHWPVVDQWWDAYTGTPLGIQLAESAPALDEKRMAPIFTEIDNWWESYADLNPVFRPSLLDFDSTGSQWRELATWWDTYQKARGDDVADLAQVLEASNALWKRQDGLFDADPLSADLGKSIRPGDPLNPGREEGWSDWLAQLLRGDSGEFHHQLFGGPFEKTPQRVVREAHLPSPAGTDRYADIISLYGSDGLSIEVKVGDTNLKKTPDTTALIEDQHYRDWHHYLLLPEQDLWAVKESFGNDVIAGDAERGTIPSKDSEPISLLYWSDVSRALRAVLIDENSQTPHWSASAYLFCARIEQDILGFVPRPVIDRIRSEERVPQALQSVTVALGDITEQYAYLTALIEATNE
ncbi:hypothetical protein [Halobaculum limi]|uniref:hypothetical protein n=1 Tax=Halobaculum limi TaxID=3031916 RepID=UPI002406769D|nr:hypothetical protein [Halobaculum sp. YSMS11]